MVPPTGKLLIIRFSSLGDILLATPFLRSLRRHSPGLELHFLLRRRYEDLLRTNPALTRLWVFDPQAGVGGLLRLAERLRQERFDGVVDLHRSLRSWLLGRLLGGSWVGYSKGRWSRALLLHWRLRRPGLGTPVPVRYLAAWPRELEVDSSGLELRVDPEAERRAAELLAGRQDWLAMGPGAKWPTKRWSLDRFAEVASGLAASRGWGVVLVGGREDQVARFPESPGVPALDLVGRLTLMETAAVLARSRLFLGNDSGLMHLAGAVGCPSVIIFGPTAEELGFFPYHAPTRVVALPLPCRPCTRHGDWRCPLGHHRCMTEVQPAAVQAAAESLLADDQRGPLRLEPGRPEVVFLP